MKALAIEQSLPICCSLAALGGILEVAATAVTAVPSVREKEGIVMKWWVQWLAIAGNVALQATGSLLSHLVATWYGPVSLVVPFFFSATLLSNMMIFGLLGEHFTKNMRVGTHVIVVAVILLPIVGPNIQEGQDIVVLLGHFYATAWFVCLLVACAISGTILVRDISKYQMRYRVAILLVARASSISVNLTVSRAFILGLNDEVLFTFIIVKVISGAIYTYAIVVQSFTVEQASFVPLNATTIIIVNALTGIIIWEDWRVVSSWYGYICIFFLLGLGCDLLLSVPLLNAENPEFSASKRVSLIIPQTVSRISSRGSASSPTPTTKSSQGNYGSMVKTPQETAPVSRIEAWKQVVSPASMENSSSSFGETGAYFTYSDGVSTPPNGSGYTTPSRIVLSAAVAAETICLLGATTGTKGTTSPHPQQLSRLAAWRETLSPNPTSVADICDESGNQQRGHHLPTSDFEVF